MKDVIRLNRRTPRTTTRMSGRSSPGSGAYTGDRYPQPVPLPQAEDKDGQSTAVPSPATSRRRSRAPSAIDVDANTIVTAIMRLSNQLMEPKKPRSQLARKQDEHRHRNIGGAH